MDCAIYVRTYVCTEKHNQIHLTDMGFWGPKRDIK